MRAYMLPMHSWRCLMFTSLYSAFFSFLFFPAHSKVILFNFGISEVYLAKAPSFSISNITQNSNNFSTLSEGWM